jgi:hypothetical protein
MHRGDGRRDWSLWELIGWCFRLMKKVASKKTQGNDEA